MLFYPLIANLFILARNPVRKHKSDNFIYWCNICVDLVGELIVLALRFFLVRFRGQLDNGTKVGHIWGRDSKQ